jgi:tRNA(Ile)-lysidine synthetase-like protein
MSTKYNFNDVYTFWFSNPKYWIPITEKDKEIADKNIYDNYFDKNYLKDISPTDISQYDNKSLIGFIIFYDQFYRHFLRYENKNNIESIINEEIILKQRQSLVNKILSILDNLILQVNEDELIYILMPFKHLSDYEYVIQNVLKWTSTNNCILQEKINLSRFFNDTYKKMYNLEKIRSTIQLDNNKISELNFDPNIVCEHYPSTYSNYENWIETITNSKYDLNNELKLLLNTIDNNKINNKINNEINNKTNNKTIIVSLSGGVDSMVTLFLLHLLKKTNKINNDLVACHIIYGNRLESIMEFDIIRQYCNRLNVSLFYYKINYIKRSEIDREFYERITRDIRFNVYKSICNDDYSVYMGHIKEDIIENIWSNFSKGQHIFDLKKMSISSIQEGVNIIRPFLNVNKSIILNIAYTFSIPFLKNTTPEWSNRGKFRNRFYDETHLQYGNTVDDKIIQVADTLSQVGKILNNLIYKPIINSFNDNIINVSRAIEADLDANGWLYIFENICHNNLHITKPSIHSINQFIERLKKYNIDNSTNNQIKIQLKNNLQFILYKKELQYYIKFILVT